MISDNEAPRPLAGEQIDLRTLLAVLWQGRWWICACIVVGTAAAIAYALLATPIYRAESIIQVRDESKDGSSLRMLAGQFGGADLSGFFGGVSSDRARVLATLRSRVLVQAFIQDAGLMPILFEKKWDEAQRRWKSDDPKDHPTLWHANKVFSEEILKVAEDKKTGLVTIAIEWRNAEQAADWVSAIIARTNQYLKEHAILEGEKNLQYLRQQVRDTGLVELQQSASTLMESELKKLMLARGTDEYALRTIDPAQAPKLKIRPKRRVIATLGLVLGGFFGVGIVLVRAAWSGSLANPGP